jgi:peptide/nickel transport system substrate-binding protein
VLKEDAAEAVIALDIVPLEIGAVVERLMTCDYDAIYMRPLATDLDPAGNLDYWLSSGSAHIWNMEQKVPATEWEQRIDALMLEQARTIDPQRRRALFTDVQKILAETVPVRYFAAPRLFYGHSRRLNGVVPSVLRQPVLWSADILSVTNP